MVPDDSSGSQEQEAAPQRYDEVDRDKGSCNDNWNRADLWCCDLHPLARHVGSRASGLVKQKLAVSWQARNKIWNKSGTKSSHLCMEHPGAAGSGEVKTWRLGVVVEAGAEAILNNLGPKQLAYILKWVGKVTRCMLASLADGWVTSQWKSWAGSWETSCGYIIWCYCW